MNASAKPAHADARIGAAIDHLSSAPGAQNDDLPYFFSALDRQRFHIDHCGGHWDRQLPPPQTERLAIAYRKAAGISALAGVLMADHETAEAGSEEPRFTPVVREGLFLALTELSNDVHNILSEVGDGLKQASRGGAA
jgi:hypothetical protein